MLNTTKNGSAIEEYSEIYDAVASSDLLDNYGKLSQRALELAEGKEFLEASASDNLNNLTSISVKFNQKTYGELIIQYETVNDGITIRLRTKNIDKEELYVQTVLSPDSVISFVPVGQTNNFDVRQRYGNRYVVDYLLEKLLARIILFISK